MADAANIWQLKEHVTLAQGPVTVADMVANSTELPPEISQLTITSLNGAAPVTVTPPSLPPAIVACLIVDCHSG